MTPPPKYPMRSPRDLPADWREAFEERAAIRTFDGGAPVDVAEREAFREILGIMREWVVRVAE